MQEKMKVGVIGSGAWGSSLADLLAGNGHDVVIYGIEKEEIDEINLKHTNRKYFNFKFYLNKRIKATLDFKEAVLDKDIIILAIPSFALVKTAKELNVLPLKKDVTLVNVAKGFDKETKKTFSLVLKDALKEELANNLVSLLGPSYAEEVAEHQFTAITSSSTNMEKAKLVQEVFSNDYFRVYTNKDVVGAEICAAMKNVMALASGIMDGMGCKVNSRAALITRGMAEITRFVVYFGGNEHTCLGLAGIGDLVLTCSSNTSRNYSAGYMIGKEGVAYFKDHNTKTVEGIYATEIAYEIALEKGIYAPITKAIYHVVFEGANAYDEIIKLMKNDLKPE